MRDWFFGSLVGCLGTLLMLSSMGALSDFGSRAAGVGSCMKVRTTEVDDERYVTTGGRTIQIQFEPDADAAATDAEISLYACTQNDAESCVEYWFDSDFDGVPDTNILDGHNLGQRGIEVVGIAGYLRVVTTTAPAAADDVAMYWVCGVQEGD